MEYVVTNRYGRVVGVMPTLLSIAEETGVPYDTINIHMQRMKPIRDKFMVIPRSKHEYLWHKHGGKRGGDDFFAFCSSEELKRYKEK